MGDSVKRVQEYTVVIRLVIKLLAHDIRMRN